MNHICFLASFIEPYVNHILKLYLTSN